MKKSLAYPRQNASTIGTGKQFRDLSSPFAATHVAESASDGLVSSVLLESFGGGWFRDELGRPLQVTDLGALFGDQPFTIRSIK